MLTVDTNRERPGSDGLARVQRVTLPVVEILGELWELPDPSLRDRWARCLRPETSGRRLDGVLDPYYWTSAATIRSIEARAGEWLMFHAAGVSDGAGNVVAMIGPSGTGKSTAARTICRTDFGYVTDETVAVRPGGSVVAFPKPIAQIPTGGGGKVELGPDELGLRPCPTELRLRGMLLLERKAGLTTPGVERLNLLQGILALVPDTSALPKVPSALARVAALADECGGVHRVTYSEAEQLVDVAHQVLTASPTQSGYHQHSGRPLTRGRGLVRSEHLDALELDGEVLIMQDLTCVLVRGVGALAWLAADELKSFDEIVAAVVDEAGEHPEAEHLVRQAVDDLLARGVLVSR